VRGLSLLVIAPIVLALSVAACGDRDGSNEAACPPAGFTSDGRETDGSRSDMTFLTGVDVTRTRCGDRVTFAFRHDVADARVEYLPREQALVEDGSGRRLDAEGDAFLVVRLSPAATAEADGDGIVMTYTGPRRFRPDDARLVREVIKTGDFEAAVTWVIALGDERPFDVSASGRELVVELA
jgi:hypothetical protein